MDERRPTVLTTMVGKVHVYRHRSSRHQRDSVWGRPTSLRPYQGRCVTKYAFGGSHPSPRERTAQAPSQARVGYDASHVGNIGVLLEARAHRAALLLFSCLIRGALPPFCSTQGSLASGYYLRPYRWHNFGLGMTLFNFLQLFPGL